MIIDVADIDATMRVIDDEINTTKLYGAEVDSHVILHEPESECSNIDTDDEDVKESMKSVDKWTSGVDKHRQTVSDRQHQAFDRRLPANSRRVAEVSTRPSHEVVLATPIHKDRESHGHKSHRNHRDSKSRTHR